MQPFVIHLGADLSRDDSVIRSHMHLYYGQGKIGRYSGDALKIEDIDIPRLGYDAAVPASQ